ncbi:Cyclin-dependent kinase 11B, partial [Fragariocoptes setiger]
MSTTSKRSSSRESSSEDTGTCKSCRVSEGPKYYYPGIDGCRSVDEFSFIHKIEEGTYGVVFKATNKRTGENVALKRLKIEAGQDGFPITSLREVNTLLKARHPHIINVQEIVFGNDLTKIYIVMEYMEYDLRTIMDMMKAPFTLGQIKTLLRQLLDAVRHLHDNWIIHRDLKPSNLLYERGILKVGDFGLAREYGSPLRAYSQSVVTLWYRAPELLLRPSKLVRYSTAIDIWSIGCIFAELLTNKALFAGKTEQHQIELIFSVLGTPNDSVWPGFENLKLSTSYRLPQYKFNELAVRLQNTAVSNFKEGLKLLNQMFDYNVAKRISADDALKHRFFDEIPRPIDPALFPEQISRPPCQGSTRVSRRDA